MIIPPGDPVSGIGSYMEGGSKLGVSNRLGLKFTNRYLSIVRAHKQIQLRKVRTN